LRKLNAHIAGKINSEIRPSQDELLNDALSQFIRAYRIVKFCFLQHINCDFHNSADYQVRTSAAEKTTNRTTDGTRNADCRSYVPRMIAYAVLGAEHCAAHWLSAVIVIFVQQLTSGRADVVGRVPRTSQREIDRNTLNVINTVPVRILHRHKRNAVPSTSSSSANA
jgi:hypothetical protein